MRAMMIKWVLPFVMDLLIEGLKKMVSNSSNDVDDKIVAVISESKEELINEIKKRL